MFSSWTSQEKETYQCKTLKPLEVGERPVSDRQERVQGWKQATLQEASVLLQGCGGINSVVGYGLARQGVGSLSCVDPDVVEASNLNRQFFADTDLYKVKGPALARRLSEEGFLGTDLTGYPLTFAEFEERYPDVAPSLVASGVDNNQARAEAVRYCLQRRIPLVVVGVARDASGAYVFVQEPGKACLGCYLGSQLTGKGRSPCPGTPAVLDVLQTIGGLALYAISSLLMSRPRTWNMAKLYMATAETQSDVIAKDPECPFCSKLQEEEMSND